MTWTIGVFITSLPIDIVNDPFFSQVVFAHIAPDVEYTAGPPINNSVG